MRPHPAPGWHCPCLLGAGSVAETPRTPEPDGLPRPSLLPVSTCPGSAEGLRPTSVSGAATQPLPRGWRTAVCFFPWFVGVWGCSGVWYLDWTDPGAGSASNVE